MKEGKAKLEDLAGVPVLGYRAPEWSLRDRAVDYWRELPGLGFTFDSSRAPLKVLGDPAWPIRPHRLMEGLWELPPASLRLAAWRVPLWGWAMRTLPKPLLRNRLRALANSDAGTPLVLHPWELDEGQPVLPEATRGHRFAHSAGLRGYGSRLRQLLKGIQLVSLETWIEAQGDRP